jgi:ADP-ribose pyrophosphatase YjhB (NUDIX family)
MRGLERVKSWKRTEDFVPRCAVQGIPVDVNGNVLLMHRGPNVRSAANCWSFPSGLHECGKYMHEQLAAELLEEFALPTLRAVHLGVYENIAGDVERPDDPQWHWVVQVFAVLVPDCHTAQNNEPEKHDKMQLLTIDQMAELSFEEYPFHITFCDWWQTNWHHSVATLRNLVTR